MVIRVYGKGLSFIFRSLGKDGCDGRMMLGKGKEDIWDFNR